MVEFRLLREDDARPSLTLEIAVATAATKGTVEVAEAKAKEQIVTQR